MSACSRWYRSSPASWLSRGSPSCAVASSASRLISSACRRASAAPACRPSAVARSQRLALRYSPGSRPSERSGSSPVIPASRRTGQWRGDSSCAIDGEQQRPPRCGAQSRSNRMTVPQYHSSSASAVTRLTSDSLNSSARGRAYGRLSLGHDVAVCGGKAIRLVRPDGERLSSCRSGRVGASHDPHRCSPTPGA